MYTNYFTTAIRSLLRQKSYAIINLTGLSVGIAAFIVLALYVQHETSYDKSLSKHDLLYRVVEIQNEPGVGEQHVAITMGPLAEALKSDFPQIVEAVRLMPAFDIQVVGVGNRFFRERNMYYSDASVISLFDVEFIEGNPATALNEPKSVVISEDVARKYFGKAGSLVGRIITMGNKPFRITGVMKNRTEDTHLFFDILISMSSIENQPGFEWMKGWGSNSLITYVLLESSGAREVIEKQFPDFIRRHVFAAEEGWEYLEMYLQPASEIYLQSQHIKFQNVTAMGNRNLVLIFSVIAVLILLVACVNYINISIARSVKRSREVGIRKVLGADRLNLVYQFIGESLLMTLMSVFLAIGLVELVLPGINTLLGTSFIIDFISNPIFNIGLIFLILLISMASGSYPAFYLSRFQPIAVLRGAIKSNSGYSGFLSKSLVVFQFAITVGLLFAVIVIFRQVNFMRNKDLGIRYKNAIFASFGNNDDYSKSEAFRQKLLSDPRILNVCGSSFVNGVSGSQGPVFVDNSAKTKLTVRFGYVDFEFFQAMGVGLSEGRFFDRTIGSDLKSTVIINEAAVRKLGWKNPVGKRFRPIMGADTTRPSEVIGVIADYHYFSLRAVVEPAIYLVNPDQFRGLLITYRDVTDQLQVQDFIRKTWGEFFTNSPYQPVFAEKYAADNYKSDARLLSLFLYFSAISVLLSVLGLFGLTSLLIEQKTRNIGIRRVLGGSAWQITIMLIRSYMLLVAIAGALALPVTFYLLNKQLDQFAYRISIRTSDLVLPVLLLIFIAFLTIVFRAYRAASANPVEALKYE